MFADYLRLSYLVPHQEIELPRHHLAVALYRRHKVAGECNMLGEHKFQSLYCPEGVRCIIDFGGSVLPIDINDFVRKFGMFRDWTISRLDLAVNLDHVSRDQIYHGQVKHIQEFYETSLLSSKVWTGVGIGRRGRASSYFRCYDARKHDKGKAAKVSRFGTYEFWRVEYEFSREFFRRKNIHTFGQLTVRMLEKLWENETNNKGVFFEGTSQYHSFNTDDKKNVKEVQEEMAQRSRFDQVVSMIRKLDLIRLVQLKEIINECEDSILDELNLESVDEVGEALLKESRKFGFDVSPLPKTPRRK